MLNKLVLICDDQKSVHNEIGRCLELEKIDYLSLYDGGDIINNIKIIEPDLILLDVMATGIMGRDICREIRKYSNIPIIILSSKSEVIDRIIGLELGADDYITKPFSSREVVARIKAILKRYGENYKLKKCVRYRDLEINLDLYQVYINDKLIKVTPKEMKILYMLAYNHNKVLKREEILHGVWGYKYIGDMRVVDTQIKRIRKKLLKYDLSWKIKSIYGVGYKLDLF